MTFGFFTMWEKLYPLLKSNALVKNEVVSFYFVEKEKTYDSVGISRL